MTCDCGAIKCGTTHYNWCSSLKPLETQKPKYPTTEGASYAGDYSPDYLDAIRYSLGPKKNIPAKGFQIYDEVTWDKDVSTRIWRITKIDCRIALGRQTITYEIQTANPHDSRKTLIATVSESEISLVSRKIDTSQGAITMTLPKASTQKVGTVFTIYRGNQIVDTYEVVE
jgi:hypothetical protein